MIIVESQKFLSSQKRTRKSEYHCVRKGTVPKSFPTLYFIQKILFEYKCPCYRNDPIAKAQFLYQNNIHVQGNPLSFVIN